MLLVGPVCSDSRVWLRHRLKHKCRALYRKQRPFRHLSISGIWVKSSQVCTPYTCPGNITQPLWAGRSWSCQLLTDLWVIAGARIKKEETQGEFLTTSCPGFDIKCSLKSCVILQKSVWTQMKEAHLFQRYEERLAIKFNFADKSSCRWLWEHVDV